MPDRKRVYLLRMLHGADRVWVVFSTTAVTRLKPRQTRRDALAWFRRQYPGQLLEVIRFTGLHRESEAAMTIASVQHPLGEAH
jgi:hypothetical protein